MTRYYYDRLAKNYPDEDFIKKGWFKEQSVAVTGYPNKIYGGNVYKTTFKD